MPHANADCMTASATSCSWGDIGPATDCVCVACSLWPTKVDTDTDTDCDCATIGGKRDELCQKTCLQQQAQHEWGMRHAARCQCRCQCGKRRGCPWLIPTSSTSCSCFFQHFLPVSATPPLPVSVPLSALSVYLSLWFPLWLPHKGHELPMRVQRAT